MKKLEVIVEDNDGLFEGYIEGVKSDTLISSAAPTVNELIDNLKMLIKSYQKNEGKNDKAWTKVDADIVEFDLKFDLTVVFKTHSYIKASAIAHLAKINPTLMSQYVQGVKKPGLKQVKKIETAIHEIGKELQELQLA